MENIQAVMFSVAEAEEFAHFGNPDYVVKEWSESFHQNIVIVRCVSWLQFIKRIPFCVKGRYCVRLHMYIGADSHWPITYDSHRTYIRIKKVGEAGTTTLVEENVPSNIWNKIIQSNFDNSQLSHSTIIPDYLNAGWHFIELESFEIKEDSDLEFDFCDTENPNRKSNIKFSFIELVK